jgi:nitroreductase
MRVNSPGGGESYRFCLGDRRRRQTDSDMDLREAIYTRRAVRDFTDAPVEDEALRGLIDAAIQAPSAVNQQPWIFCVIRDRPLLARISDAAKAHMLATTPAGLLSHHFQEILSDPGFDIFYRAPALIVIAAGTDSPWAAFDCSLAAANLMLAARGAGLGTCWIGFAQGWLGTAEGKTALGLPATVQPVAPIIVGHPRILPAAVPRRAADIRWIGR